MKDLANERLVYLATAQESLFGMTDRMEQWEHSQLILEKNSFDTMNISDKILSLSEAGSGLACQLQEHYLAGMPTGSEDLRRTAEMLHDIQNIFSQILDHSRCANETAHILEKEVAGQMELVDSMKGLVCRAMGQIDSVAACDEFLLAEF